MKRRLLLLALILGISLPSFTQTEVDVTKLVADTKTFIFDNNKNTVKGYIYDQLKEVTNCCGNDRIYLEVKIDPTGYVLQVKTLTGKNDCFKKSAIDIVKNVKWDAGDFKGPKSVYFEIKPNIDCEADRENTYAQVEVFNNEILSPGGSGNAPRKTEPIASNNTPKPSPTPTPVKTNPTPTKEDPPVKTEKPKLDPIVTREPAKATPDPVKTTPAQTRSQDPVNTNTADNMASNDNEPPAKKADELADAQKKADAERAAQEEEIRRLKEQMARLRGEEEAARERQLAQQRETNRRERERQEEETYAANNDNNSGTGGGLFLDEPANNSNSDDSYDNEPPAGQSDADRRRQEIEDLRKQISELEESKRRRLDENRRVLAENDRDNQQIIRLKEQMVEKEEMAMQAREEEELRRLEDDRRRAEDTERKEQDEYQRMMDEIRRLQQEAERKIAEIENQKRDIERLAAAKQAREQEIMLDRTLRQKESEQRLEAERLALLNNSGSSSLTSPIADASTDASTVDMADASNIGMPTLTTAADSQKYMALARQVGLLRVELERLREQLRIMEGGVPPAKGNYASGNTVSGVKPQRRTANGNLTNGATDDSWKNIDYLPEDANKEDYIIADANITRSGEPPVVIDNNPANNVTDPPANKDVDKTVPEYESGEGYQGSKDHRGSYKNVAGPKFFPRNYIDGKSAMKEKISTSLKEAGVCGLAQSAFSVKIDPKGNVLTSQVLAASSALVELQLGAILPTLKFNEVDIRYDQTIYLEFKADIACEGFDDVKLQNVESIIKNESDN